MFTYQSFLRQRNQEGRQAWETTAEAVTKSSRGREKSWETRRQRQPRAAQNGDYEKRQAWEKRRQWQRGAQKGNEEGKQIGRQEQPRREIRKETSLEDKAAAAAPGMVIVKGNEPKRKIMKRNKLGDKAAARETSLGDKAAAASKSSPVGKS